MTPEVVIRPLERGDTDTLARVWGAEQSRDFDTAFGYQSAHVGTESRGSVARIWRRRLRQSEDPYGRPTTPSGTLSGVASPQQEIYLFNLPMKALKRIIDDAGLSAPREPTKLDLVKLISGQLSDPQLEAAAGDLMYAGSTSITWIQLVSEDDPPTAMKIDLKAFREAMEKEIGKDPFDNNVRPEIVTGTPKVMDARQMNDGTIVLTFVVRKRVRVVFQNFEPVPVHEDDFFLVVVRPELGLFEVRSAHQRAEQLLRGFLGSVASRMDARLSFVPIAGSDLAALKKSLKAKLHRYRGKHNTGSAIDMHDMSKAEDCDDLDEEKEFEQYAKDTMPMQVDWVFQYEGGPEVRIQVSARYGSIWFRTPASEEIIEHVFGQLRSVQGK